MLLFWFGLLMFFEGAIGLRVISLYTINQTEEFSAALEDRFYSFPLSRRRYALTAAQVAAQAAFISLLPAGDWDLIIPMIALVVYGAYALAQLTQCRRWIEQHGGQQLEIG